MNNASEHNDNASEHDIARILAALRDTEPTSGLETRILHALENRTPARSTWFGRTSPMHWSIAALATAAVILAVALTTRNTHLPTTTIAQSSDDPSSREASSPAKLGPHNPLSRVTPNRVIPTQKYVILSTAKDLLPAHTQTKPYPPHDLLCDCDPLAMAEMQAPSLPAPAMPLTHDERMLMRAARRGEFVEVAELEPVQNRALRPPASAREDDPLQFAVRGFLKQLAAAETLNPTPPEPPPAAIPNPSDAGPAVESTSSPN